MDSDIQEISEQIHRLLLQVRKCTLDQSAQSFMQKCIGLCNKLIFLFSRSITWAPVVTGVMVVTVPMNSR